jgi:5-methylcytosine-specific restriction endonuclease McrA
MEMFLVHKMSRRQCLDLGVKVCKTTYYVSKYFASNFLVDPLVVQFSYKPEDDEYLYLPPRPSIKELPSHVPRQRVKKTLTIQIPDADGIIRFKRDVTHTMKMEVAAKQHWKCKHCMDELDETMEIDHIIALCVGGTNEITNLAALCAKCHRRKTNKERSDARLQRKSAKTKQCDRMDIESPTDISPYF